MFVGVYLIQVRGYSYAWLLIGFFIGWIIPFLLSVYLSRAAGDAAATFYMPSGSSTPGDRQYSLAQSLAVRGKFDEAAAEYERCSLLYPTDPEPCMRLARLYRDELQRYDDAILWFKRASAIPSVPPGTDVAATRELIEVYTHRLRQPAAALPHMARLAARHPATPAGEWAKRELALAREQLRAEQS